MKRTALGAYEEGRAEPRLAALVRLAHVLDVSLDALVLGGTERRMEQDVRVLPIPVDRGSDRERITAVSVKAAAGYAAGLGDPEWIAALPHFSLPCQRCLPTGHCVSSKSKETACCRCQVALGSYANSWKP